MDFNIRFVGCPRRFDFYNPCRHDIETENGHWCDLGLTCFDGSEYEAVKDEKEK